jgi:hypothetical protein
MFTAYPEVDVVIALDRVHTGIPAFASKLSVLVSGSVTTHPGCVFSHVFLLDVVGFMACSVGKAEGPRLFHEVASA